MRRAGGSSQVTPDQDATLWVELIRKSGLGYLWLIALAMWGGTSSYLSRIRRERIPFSLFELMGEWAISGFAGIVTSYVCYSLQWDFYLIAAATGIAGHMGGRAIVLIESLILRKLGVKACESERQP